MGGIGVFLIVLGVFFFHIIISPNRVSDKTLAVQYFMLLTIYWKILSSMKERNEILGWILFDDTNLHLNQ